MEIMEALRIAADRANWKKERIAVCCDLSFGAVNKWFTGESAPKGDAVVALQRELPGFADLLLKNDDAVA